MSTRQTNNTMSATTMADTHGYCAASGSGPFRAISLSDNAAQVECQRSQPMNTAMPMPSDASNDPPYRSQSNTDACVRWVITRCDSVNVLSFHDSGKA